MKLAIRKLRTLWHLAGFLTSGGCLVIEPAPKPPAPPTPVTLKTPPTQAEREEFYKEQGWMKVAVEEKFNLAALLGTNLC